MTIAPNRTTTCRGCGKQVMFIRTNDGLTVALDPHAICYTRVWDPDSDLGFWIRDTTNETFVRHACARTHSGNHRLTPR